jgi:hypothetical protein
VDLILHIGTAKTGTTSLQEFLAANRAILRREGILYPLSAGEGKDHALLSLIPQEDLTSSHAYALRAARAIKNLKVFRRELKKDLTKELNSWTDRKRNKVIMSSEYCSTRLLTDEAVEGLRDFLSPIFSDIKIVVYIRRQDEYLLSRYSTGVKAGGTARLEIPSSTDAVAFFDHWELLSRWARFFGRAQIVCRKYERDSMKSGDVIDDFLDLARIDKLLPFKRPERKNESLDAGCVEFLRIFNTYYRPSASDPVSRRGRIVAMLSEISTGSRLTLDREKLDGFMRTFSESNKKVALEYFGGATKSDSDDFLFGPRENIREPAIDPGLTVDRAIEIAAHLWDANRTRIEGLLRQVKRERKNARFIDTDGLGV